MTLHLKGVWLLLMTHTVLVFCDIEFLERTQGDSVEFYCISEFNASKAIGLYVKRKWMQPNQEVLFMLTEEKPSFYTDVKERIHVTGDPSTHRVNVTLSQLKGTDTDLYYCEFVFPVASSFDQKIPSKMEFFLYIVDAGVRCSCTSYTPLLYVLSAAVGLLLIFLMALGVAHYGKTRGNSVKTQPHQVSIYEEMVGVRPPNRNGKVAPSYHPKPPFHLEEKDGSTYDIPPLRSRQENHYERPEGVPLVSETVGGM
uniref:Immunoglobulin V-set domain-containing protein n=1 Tax=Hucho hucho TaxID=62062 RepID=A0A4W5KK75_9TELE